MNSKLITVVIVLAVISCTAGVAPKGNRIEVVYIGSIYDDIYSENPVSASVGELSGIKLGHTLTRPVFMEYFLQRMGLSDLMADLGLDFVIGDTIVQGLGYFGLSRAMGYGIKNVEGIRFALVSAIRDSLTMDDQIRFTLLKERSDILWVIDKSLIELSPTLIRFHVRNRSLSDTSMTTLTTKTDTARVRKILNFRKTIDKELNKMIAIMGRIDDHVFSLIAQRETLDVVIYPAELFTRLFEEDSVSLRNLMENVAFETKFTKTTMDSTSIIQMCAKHGYSAWGRVKKTNAVLVPDVAAGRYIFDYYYKRGENEN
ncbi:MAG: hypothetical protein JSW49_07160 [candidate division WOR-3 bacterium]|nr:MAG: hypothetical protein JSW49_07160 [candidate division WOR-3 bacterium]